jgi:iron complex transport system permease protein
LYQRPAGERGGIIGFIGLFAPLLAKMLGARRLLARLLLAALIGALILWLSDQVILWLAGSGWKSPPAR